MLFFQSYHDGGRSKVCLLTSGLPCSREEPTSCHHVEVVAFFRWVFMDAKHVESKGVCVCIFFAMFCLGKNFTMFFW